MNGKKGVELSVRLYFEMILIETVFFYGWGGCLRSREPSVMPGYPLKTMSISLFEPASFLLQHSWADSLQAMPCHLTEDTEPIHIDPLRRRSLLLGTGQVRSSESSPCTDRRYHGSSRHLSLFRPQCAYLS